MAFFYTKDRKKCEKSFDFFSLHGIKMEKKVLSFSEKHIIKNKFHIHKGSLSVNEVDIERIELSKKNHMVVKVHLNTFLDIYIKVLLFHHHYV